MDTQLKLEQNHLIYQWILFFPKYSFMSDGNIWGSSNKLANR